MRTEMSTMIERVAQRLYAEAGYTSWSGMGEAFKESYRRQARAAIEAMREPTEAVGEDGQESQQQPVAWRWRTGKSSRHAPDVWEWSPWKEGRKPDHVENSQHRRYDEQALYLAPPAPVAAPASPVAMKTSDILSQIALWSDDEGLDLSMGQGDDLARRIMKAVASHETAHGDNQTALPVADETQAWRSMDSAPKDGTKILVAYDSKSDPYIEDEKTGRLTAYATHAEGGDFLDGKGVTVAVWVPGWHESTDEYGSGYWMPGCWFAWFNDDTDYVVAPTGWMPLPAASHTGEDA